MNIFLNPFPDETLHDSRESMKIFVLLILALPNLCYIC